MNNFRKKLPGTPYFFWSVLFIIIPLCMVFYYGLTDKSGAFTLENIIAVTTREHSKALWLSLLLSLIATVICLLLSYPLAMILCSRKGGQHSVIVFIFILPMWMNFLLRTLAWQTLLEKTGVINSIDVYKRQDIHSQRNRSLFPHPPIYWPVCLLPSDKSAYLPADTE